MNDIKDPMTKRKRLIERRDHIGDQVRELLDRQYIIQCEIDALTR